MVTNRKWKKGICSAFSKDVLREILKTKNRFLSIFLIVAIGVGFFSGLTASGPDMKLTADTYFDNQNLSDFRLVSTMGFTDDDVQALRKTEGIQVAEPGHWVDTVLETEGDSEVVKVMGYDFDQLHEGGEGKMNVPLLLEGRFPQSPDECVVEATEEILGVSFQVGDTIALTSGKADTDLADTLAGSCFTIVGIVQNPLYISIDRGTSTIGSGKVNAFIMVPNDAFLEDYYTEIYLRAEDVEGLSSYSQEYRQQIQSLIPSLEKLGEERAVIRLEEVRKEANEKIADAQKELDEGVEIQQKELADARKELDDAREKLKDGEIKLADATQEYYDSIADAQQQIADARQKLNDGEKEYASGLREYEKGEAAYDKALAEALPQIEESEQMLAQKEQELTQGQAQYDQVRTLVPDESTVSAVLSDPYADPSGAALLIGQLSALSQADTSQEWAGDLADYLSNPAEITPQENAYHLAVVRQVNLELDEQGKALDDGWLQLNEGKQQLAESKQQLYSAGSQLDDAAAQLKKARAELDDGWTQLTEKEREFQDGKEEGWQEILNARQELSDGKQGLADGEKEYEEGKAESDQEIADAKKELEQARKDLNELEVPEWYVLDRTDYPGHSDFGDDSDRIAAIARVFPVFFLLVAALVCLTTMTRMVEERRTQIGTLKALGYGNIPIMAKYLLYAMAATILGCAVGLSVGFVVFPSVLFLAYSSAYNIPDNMMPFHWGLAGICTAVGIVCMVGATLLACYKELLSNPATLMRPKAPPAGKKILLERWTGLWKKIPFAMKLTLRNLLRYKKRAAMTIIGIGGCTALMLTGFGMQYGISSIVDKQYDTVMLYDAVVSLKEGISETEKQDTFQEVQQIDGVTEQTFVRMENITVETGNQKPDTVLLVMKNTDSMDSYINLHTRTQKTPIQLTEEGVVLSEKLARVCDLKVGDSITLTLNHKTIEVPVTAICENYVANYVFMTPSLYEKTLGDLTFNCILLNTKGEEYQNSISTKLTENESIMGASFSKDNADNFRNVVKNLNSVVVVIIISAGALAFIVLYNLVNINVAERTRELATLKVLGYNDHETSSYIYRENIICTVLGILLGLFGGIFLEQFVIRTAEVDAAMFAPEIPFYSFLFAGVLTLLFTLVVNVALHFKLKKLDMVESLKSIE